jgi:hypothetical protein
MCEPQSQLGTLHRELYRCPGTLRQGMHSTQHKETKGRRQATACYPPQLQGKPQKAASIVNVKCFNHRIHRSRVVAGT